MAIDISPILAIDRAAHRAGDRRRPDRGLSGRGRRPGQRPCWSARRVVALDQASKDVVREQHRARGRRSRCCRSSTSPTPATRGSPSASPAASRRSLIGVDDRCCCSGCWSTSSLAAATADPLIWLPAGLLIGGALGNLADRVRDGAVTDFIDLPVWPTFNLADVAIVVGVVLLVLLPEIAAERRSRARARRP